MIVTFFDCPCIQTFTLDFQKLYSDRSIPIPLALNSFEAITSDRASPQPRSITNWSGTTPAVFKLSRIALELAKTIGEPVIAAIRSDNCQKRTKTERIRASDRVIII